MQFGTNGYDASTTKTTREPRCDPKSLLSGSRLNWSTLLGGLDAKGDLRRRRVPRLGRGGQEVHR